MSESLSKWEKGGVLLFGEGNKNGRGEKRWGGGEKERGTKGTRMGRADEACEALPPEQRRSKDRVWEGRGVTGGKGGKGE